MTDAVGRKLSAYVLTLNSERMIDRVLAPLTRVADEILVLDSGSTDRTLEIARSRGCRVEISPFEDFARQRQKAQSLCSHDRVMFVDSDEIMSDALVDAILALKSSDYGHDAYTFRREWIVLGRKVHAFYPVTSPDYPIRLLDRTVSDFVGSRAVHEYPKGHRSLGVIDAPLLHVTYQTPEECEKKLEMYSRYSALDVLDRGRWIPSPPLAVVGALSAFVKWYIGKQCWKDGRVGLTAGFFAARYTYRKYGYARQLAAASPKRSTVGLKQGEPSR